jgi:hypothetical protein
VLDPLNTRADSCNKDAEDNSRAKHADMSARTKQQVSFFPSILVEGSIPRALIESRSCNFVTLAHPDGMHTPCVGRDYMNFRYKAQRMAAANAEPVTITKAA